MFKFLVLGFFIGLPFLNSHAQSTVVLNYLQDTTVEELEPIVVDSALKSLDEALDQKPLFVDKKMFQVSANYELSKFVGGVLNFKNIDQLSWAEFMQAVPKYVSAEIKNCTLNVSGKSIVLFGHESKQLDKSCNLWLGPISSYAVPILLKLRFDNAMSRVKSSTALDAKELYAAWKLGNSNKSSNLDNSFVLPIQIVSDCTIDAIAMRIGFGKYYFLEGEKALEEFFSGGESAEKAEFIEMYTLLKNAPNLKIYFFGNSGNNWTNHVLLVIDENQQMFRFDIGYSE